MQRWVIVFNKVFDEDDYTPIRVENKTQYKSALEKFPYRDSEVEKVFQNFMLYNKILYVYLHYTITGNFFKYFAF